MKLTDDLEPRLIGRYWHFADGTILPFVSGAAEGDDDGAGDGAGDGGDDVAGGAGDGDGGDGGAGDGDDDALGPKGTKALEAEKGKRRAAQAQLREWKALGKTPAEIKTMLEAAAGGDGQPDPQKIRDEAKAEAQAELMESRILDKIEAKAARLFADPDDAAALLMRDHDADDFLDDGKIDVEAIQDALSELLEKKPYLATQGGKKFQGGGDGGARKETRPAQLSRSDLEGMSAEAIEEARLAGRLDDLMSGKST